MTDALCCECGTVRKVSSNGRNGQGDPYSDSEGHTDEQVARDRANGFAVGMEPFWRCLRLLKCVTCGERTRHATVRLDEHRDYAEQQDRDSDRLRRRLTAHLGMLEVEGVEISWDTSEDMGPHPVELIQFRDDGREWWVLSLDRDAPTGVLWSCLKRAEEAIFSGGLPFAWRQDQEDERLQWRGRHFRASTL
ncbi:hypothetical protein [Phycicoccus sp.]|uniref:hypothetical protein n=1 Tax=Phycicoccus sp. TaxID=1902410 RepID=UPI002C4EAFC3|nr:hypothetical protein [Phycicoccus sp.]HMM93967.1 hypothetical protein [Phycicoccus sp.]